MFYIMVFLFAFIARQITTSIQFHITLICPLSASNKDECRMSVFIMLVCQSLQCCCPTVNTRFGTVKEQFSSRDCFKRSEIVCLFCHSNDSVNFLLNLIIASLFRNVLVLLYHIIIIEPLFSIIIYCPLTLFIGILF